MRSDEGARLVGYSPRPSWTANRVPAAACEKRFTAIRAQSLLYARSLRLCASPCCYEGTEALKCRGALGRARRFSRGDPFFGKLLDPSSLHRFLYGESDPVNRSDPSGNFALSIGSLVSVGSRMLSGLNTVSLSIITFRLSYRTGTLLYDLLLAEEKISLEEAAAEALDIGKEAATEIAMNYLLNIGSLKGLASVARKLGQRGILRTFEVAQINGRLAEHLIGNKYLMWRNTARFFGKVPDFIDTSVIREIKNVAVLRWSGRIKEQLSALATGAKATGRQFFIHVRPGTDIHPSVAQNLEQIFGPGQQGILWDIIEDLSDTMRVVG